MSLFNVMKYFLYPCNYHEVVSSMPVSTASCVYLHESFICLSLYSETISYNKLFSIILISTCSFS